MAEHMHVRLSEERREALAEAVREHWRAQFDEELSAFRAGSLIDFFVARLGPQVYNQAIQDARGFLQERLDDLDAEYYEPEAD